VTLSRGPERAVVVRRAGGLQLRLNGTLASFHRPGLAVTGPVWWALAAPVVLLRPGARRILLLGLGAGSVAGVLRILDPHAEIVGVELDRVVLRLARRHFGLDGLGLEVVVDDVFRYLRRERRRFDLIVEDVFVGALRSVHKPPGLLEVAYPLLGRRLRPGGLVVSNTIHESPAVVRAMRPFGGRVISLDVKRHWNRIVVGGRGLPSARQVRRRLSGVASLARLLRQVSVRER
jgi:predicted membrane-bound spermidine synthase